MEFLLTESLTLVKVPPVQLPRDLSPQGSLPPCLASQALAAPHLILDSSAPEARFQLCLALLGPGPHLLPCRDHHTGCLASQNRDFLRW